MKQLRVIISGGGTGGHIFPALAIARALEKKNKNLNILFVGSKGRMEMKKVPAENYKIKGLWISGFQRKLSLRNLIFPIKLISSLLHSFFIVRNFRPHLVIGTGGYASGPLLFVAAKCKIPTLIQEQNSYPGMTNRILSRYVNKVCVSYNKMSNFFPKNKIALLGNPVRKNIIDLTISKTESLNFFGLNSKQKTILVIGGSLGALSINEAIKNKIQYFNEHKINLIWQTGERYYELAAKLVNQNKYKNIKVKSFIKKMDYAYSCADIIVSRAGAIAISELCCIGKPTILIPSPNVAENHQYKNAQSLVNKKATILVEDIKANRKLVQEVIKLVLNKSKQKELSKNIKELAFENAAENIAELSLKMLK